MCFDVRSKGARSAGRSPKSARVCSAVIASGFALGAVLTLHTRSTLVTFGATAWIPTVQALAFFLEIGPLVTGLLVAGRVGSGIGAVLSNMRATEQIDAIESLSIDSFKFLVVPASSRAHSRFRS